MLGIHVIGSGFGESIIIEMPNGGVGVIDCFSPVLNVDSAQIVNPTLRFVQTQLGAKRLAFLCLTHPHEDHGRGISHLLAEYEDRIDQIWIFDAFQDEYLRRYFHGRKKLGHRLPIERLLSENPGTFAIELFTVRNLVIKQIQIGRPTRAILRTFSGSRADIRINGEPITVHFLGPSEALAQRYKAQLIDNIAEVVTHEGEVDFNNAWRLDEVNHNLASPAIVLEYGQTRAILGGDMERDGWREVLRDGALHHFACAFVKVCHHGSVTGYVEGLYDKFGVDGLPLAVLTPFNRHARPLPRRDALEHLGPRTSELWTTSIVDAYRSLKIVPSLTIDELSRLRPILKKWKSDVDADPRRWASLDPDFVERYGGNAKDRAVESALPVPSDWLNDLSAEPRLAAILHPDIRDECLAGIEKTEPVENTYRLSFFFDDSGHELRERRYEGAACGRLPYQPTPA